MQVGLNCNTPKVQRVQKKQTTNFGLNTALVAQYKTPGGAHKLQAQFMKEKALGNSMGKEALEALQEALKTAKGVAKKKLQWISNEIAPKKAA